MSRASAREKYGLPPLNITKPAPAAPPAGAVWNGIRRLWMVDGVACDPQPPAPLVASAQNFATIAIHKRGDMPAPLPAGTVPVLPAVKVEV